MNWNMRQALRYALMNKAGGEGAAGGGNAGGPGQGEGGNPAGKGAQGGGEGGGEQLFEVTVGKKKLKVNQATKEIIEAMSEAHGAELTALQGKLDTALAGNKGGNKGEGGEGKGEGGEGKPLTKKALAKMLFEDPEGFLDHFSEALIGRVSGMYQQTEGQKAFWSAFYKENAGLQKADMIVKAVLSRDFDELGSMKAAEARKELAKRVKKEMLDLGMKLKDEGEGEGGGEGGHVAEGGSEGGRGAGKGEGGGSAGGGNGGKVLTLTSLLRNRAADRAKLRQSAGQKTG